MNRLQTISTRMGPDLRDAIEVMPGLGGVALWVKFVDSDDPALIAATDGATVAAGPRYHEYGDCERRFILLHQLLHVALAHPARAREMEKRIPDFDRRLHHVACDCIVNTALDGVRGILMPAAAVTLKEVLTLVGGWKEGDNPAEVLRRWSSEALYHLLAESGKRTELLTLGARSDDQNEDIPTSADWFQAGSSPSAEDVSTGQVIRAWASRLAAARGPLAQILNRLALEMPRVKTPWERILRDLLFRHSQRQRRPDPARPSRRWLALEGSLREREGVELPFERSVRPSRTGRIALAVDTSGSINDALLARFAAEVAAVLEQTDPQLRLIVCDAAVHEVRDFAGREGAKHLRGFKFRGGGGTDFRPAIDEAAKWRPDLLIYLTDLKGEAGTEPNFPILWAIPEGRPRAPWGRIVELV